jgi:hypothetical protein
MSVLKFLNDSKSDYTMPTEWGDLCFGLICYLTGVLYLLTVCTIYYKEEI